MTRKNTSIPVAKFAIGDVVRHRLFPFRGVIFDVAIPEAMRPRKDQPFYHLLAETDEDSYLAYVSEGNLLPDDSGLPVGHPRAAELFHAFKDGHYVLRPRAAN